MLNRKGCLTAAALFAAVLSHGQAAEEVMLEGRLLACDTQTRMINVMGIGIYVPAEAVIQSPTRKLAFGELKGAAFPGRIEKGFLNGIAIVEAVVRNGQSVATSITIEPEETVLLGPIHWVNGQFTILGKPITLIQDSRLLGRAFNAGGLPVTLGTAVEGSGAAAEGYVGTDGTFYAFRIEADDAEIPSGTVATAVVRSRARSVDELEISGGTTALSGVVRVRNADTGALIGDLTIQNTGRYGTFFGRIQVAQMPARVQVTTLSNGSRCLFTVDQ